MQELFLKMKHLLDKMQRYIQLGQDEVKHRL